MIRTWLTGIGRRSTSNRLARARRGHHRNRLLALEGLEDRALMTAMTYTVNSLGDTGAGSGTSGDLRYAITQADLNAGSAIRFGVTGTIQLSSMLPALTADMTITGPGASDLTVQGGGVVSNFSLLTVSGGATASISGLTLTNGHVIGQGGGVVNRQGASLTLSGCTVSSNSVMSATGTASVITTGLGGGIYNEGRMAIVSSSLSSNSAEWAGGGIYNVGELTVDGSTLAGNTARFGGGLANSYSVNSLGQSMVSNSTFWGNNGGTGGAILNSSILSLFDSTLSGNTSAYPGGGLYVAGTTELSNTIVAGNARLGDFSASDLGGDPVNVPASKNNLIGVGGFSGLINGVNGNLVGVSNPGLGVLADNGGATKTIALLAGSPAIDAGNNALAVEPATGRPLTTDQRGAGYARISGTNIDIGAVESAGPDVTASRLAVTISPPGQVGLNVSFGLAVVAEDALGNVATGFNGPVTVSLGNNPGLATLGGTLTATAVNGVAWFPGLTLDQTGTGYTLQVSGAGLDPAATAGFDVTTATESKLAVTTQPPASAVSGSPFSVVVTAEDADGNIATDFNGYVVLSTYKLDGNGNLLGPIFVKAVNGVATFTGLTVIELNPYIAFQVSAAGLTSAITNVFSAVPGPATGLRFFTAGGTVPVGEPFPTDVLVLDAWGNVATSYDGPVTISLANNPGGATLGGALTVNAVDGEATFSGLTIDRPGAAYTFQITGPGLAPATSNVMMTVTASPPPPTQDYVIGSDDQVYAHAVDASGKPTGNYYPVAYGQVKDLAAIRLNSGSEIFVVGTDDQVYTANVGTSEGHYFAAAFGSVASISVVADASGNVLLFAVGTDNQLYELKCDTFGRPLSSSYTRAAYGDFRSTVLTHDTAGNALVYAIGQDRQVYGLRTNVSGTPSGGVFKMGAGGVKQLIVGSYSFPQTPELFVVGLDDYVYGLAANGSGGPDTGYFMLGGPAVSITVGSNSLGAPILFAVGTDNLVYLQNFTGHVPTGRFQAVISGSVTMVAAGVDFSGRPELFAVFQNDSQAYYALLSTEGGPLTPFTLISPGAVKKIVVT